MNYCDKNDDGICLCPVCGTELDDVENLEVQTGPSSTLPDYEKQLKCSKCDSVCGCQEGAPKERSRPSPRA